MAIETRQQVKDRFDNGDKPTETGFHNGWDSTNFRTSTGATNMDGDITSLGIKFTRLNIGDWDMDADFSVLVTMPTNFKNPNGWAVVIINDASDNISPISGPGASVSANAFIGAAGDMSLTRALGGFFDNPAYDSTSFHRGFVTVWKFE